jgi:hypothetical protein
MEITMLSGYDTDQCKKVAPRAIRVRRFIPNVDIIQQGKIPTAVFLRENKIPFCEVVDPAKESGSLVVTTPNGVMLNVPTIITKDQAQQVLTQYNAPVQTLPSSPTAPVPPATTTPPEKPKNFSWWLVAAAVAGLCLLSSDTEAPKFNGLSGTPTKTKTVKTKRKAKPRVIHI